MRKKKKLKIPSNQGGERVQVAFLNGKSYRTTELKAMTPSFFANFVKKKSKAPKSC